MPYLNPRGYLPPILGVLLAVAAGAVVVLLLAPTYALAATASTADPTPPAQLVLPTDQLWALLASSVVPLFTYAINRAAPWTAEPIKAFVLAVGAAVAAGITQALTAGNVGFNEVTLQFIATGVIGAFFAHAQIWLRSGVAARLGSGQNKQRTQHST